MRIWVEPPALFHNATRLRRRDPQCAEAFRGFINLFDDYLAPELMQHLSIPVDLIWGEKDPWEPLPEAQRWRNTINCVRSLTVIPGSGHCPHDENPEQTNKILTGIIYS